MKLALTISWSLKILLLISHHYVYSFRINVPRVLLPYHPKIQVQFLLEVTYPEGGCFTWRSSSTDVVSVEVLHPKNSGCSDKAIITSRSRHTYQQTAIIFAEDLSSSVFLSCEVTVDNIQSIAITTTTKILFVDAAPVLLIIEAFNKEGDRFSTLGTIPFNWSFNYNEGRPLHIVPFSHSKYEAPSSIEKLEQNQKKGYMVLVEGVLTGSAQLSATFQKPYLSAIDASTIDLFVLANVMLNPSHDLYLSVYSTVKYDAIILRKGRTEPINLPSNQYQLQLSNTTTCNLDSITSLVTAKSMGSTEILLIDTYMKPKADIKPRSAYIYVVEPDTIQFAIDQGNNWYLQLNAEYEITVKLTDQHGNSIYISDNAIFKTAIAETYFTILQKSKNSTHFRVKTKKAGKLSIKSTFTSLLDANDKPILVKTVVTGEQKLEILTPITILPKTLFFPRYLHHQYQYQMMAVGGSGTYFWSSNKSSIAKIEESTGLVTSGITGEVMITAKDAFNVLNRGTAKCSIGTCCICVLSQILIFL